MVWVVEVSARSRREDRRLGMLAGRGLVRWQQKFELAQALKLAIFVRTAIGFWAYALGFLHSVGNDTTG